MTKSTANTSFTNVCTIGLGLVLTVGTPVAGRASFSDAAAFHAPEAIYSPGYFWMLNAPMERTTMESQLDEMAAKGLRAVCPHPFPKLFRPGACESEMSPDYLSDDYLKAYAQIVAKAKALGQHVWLYDEGGWPSGSACRLVAQSDREGKFCVRYLALNGETGAYDLKVEPHGGSWGYNPSVIEPGATEHFLELTHEAYLKTFGSEFGQTVRFAFTDEPTRPSARSGKLPWASDFDAEFRARKGYDIRPFLPVLFDRGKKTDERGTRARIDYEDVMSQLFTERYLLKLRGWCRAHGIASGGHLNGEDLPWNSVSYGHGSLLRGLRAMDVPGVDTIWRQLFPRDGHEQGRILPFPRYAASAAHQNGGRVVLSESFGIYGNTLTPAQMKWCVDCQLVRGVTAFVFAYYAMSNENQWMLLFEPHTGPIQPYWNFMAPFFRYVHRMSALLARGRPDAEIAVLYDIRDFWAGGDDCNRAHDAHIAVSSALDRRNCDFDFIEDEQLVSATFANGRIRIGAMDYSTVVLPYSRRMLPAARAKLDAFRAAGGRVLGPNDVLDAPRTLCVSGEGADDIRVLKRVDGAETLYFLANEAMEPRTVRINFGGTVPAVLAANDRTGDFDAIASEGGALTWSFPAAGSAAFVIGAKTPETASAEPQFGNPLALGEWTAQKLVEHVPGQHAFEIVKTPDAPFAPIELGDWRKTFGDLFSGRVLYRTTFDAAQAGRARIDLGEVRGAARVTLNGRLLDTFFYGPCRVDADVASGRNTLDVEVANTLGNAVSTDAVRDRIISDNPPRSSYDVYQRPFDKTFTESGLYGPVTVRLRAESDK